MSFPPNKEVILILVTVLKSFLVGTLFWYIIFCLSIVGGQNIKENNHRWFWILSIYIGRSLVMAFGVAFVIVSGYLVLVCI